MIEFNSSFARTTGSVLKNMSGEYSFESIPNEHGLDIEDKSEEAVAPLLAYSLKSEELEEFTKILKSISDRCLPGQILQQRELALDRFKCK